MSRLRSQIKRLREMALMPQDSPPGSCISCTRQGMRTAALSVVSVRRALTRRRPQGRTVFSPSSCWQRKTENWQRCSRPMDSRVSVSASNCSSVSAICTSVTTAKIMRWSRSVRSDKNSFVSERSCSSSQGMAAVKLFRSFCRCCQRVMSLSIPKIRLWISFTASSVGMGRMSMDSMRLRSKSDRSEIISSSIQLAYSLRKRTRPYLPPISKCPALKEIPSGQTRSLKSTPCRMAAVWSKVKYCSSPGRKKS